MVVCGQCGERNTADAKFCRNCEVFLEWEGEPVTQPVPVATAQPPSPPVHEPAPVQPTDRPRPQHHRPLAEPTERPPAPGDLICGACGVGNAPVRRFCRRCAAPLADAVVVRRPWWRRLLDRLSGLLPRRRRVRPTGERPSPGRSRGRSRVGAVVATTFRTVRWAVGGLLAIAVLAYFLVPSFRAWVKPQVSSAWARTKSVVAPDYESVRPTAVTAAVSHPEHPAALVSDLDHGTHWAVPSGGAQPSLTFTFESGVDLRRVIVHNGTGPGPGFTDVYRARELHVMFSNGHTTNLTLADVPTPQTLNLSGGAGSTEVRVLVVSAYQSGQVPDVAIAEIEFYERR